MHHKIGYVDLLTTSISDTKCAMVAALTAYRINKDIRDWKHNISQFQAI